MKNDNYNNLAISIVAFLSVIRNIETLTFAKSMLILPLALHNPLVNYMKSKRTNVKGIEDLTLDKVKFFLNFHQRYLSFLTLGINTLLVIEKMDLIKININEIVINKNKINEFDFSSDLLGMRARNIILSSEKISKLLEEDACELYFKLRIQI